MKEKEFRIGLVVGKWQTLKTSLMDLLMGGRTDGRTDGSTDKNVPFLKVKPATIRSL